MKSRTFWSKFPIPNSRAFSWKIKHLCLGTLQKMSSGLIWQDQKQRWKNNEESQPFFWKECFDRLLKRRPVNLLPLTHLTEKIFVHLYIRDIFLHHKKVKNVPKKPIFRCYPIIWSFPNNSSFTRDYPIFSDYSWVIMVMLFPRWFKQG